MTREEIIRFLKQLQQILINSNSWKSVKQVIRESFTMAIEALEAQRWIPCSERLPEEGQIVLATHLGGLDPSRQVIEHIYSGGRFLMNWDMDMNMDSPTFGKRYMGKVIAWMPLPDPYTENNDG